MNANKIESLHFEQDVVDSFLFWTGTKQAVFLQQSIRDALFADRLTK